MNTRYQTIPLISLEIDYNFGDKQMIEILNDHLCGANELTMVKATSNFEKNWSILNVLFYECSQIHI